MPGDERVVVAACPLAQRTARHRISARVCVRSAARIAAWVTAWLWLALAAACSSTSPSAAGGSDTASDAASASDAPTSTSDAPGPGSDAGSQPPPGAPPLPSFATTSTCDSFANVFSAGNTYFVMNNVFNDAAGSQCFTASGTGFTITTANHNVTTSGPPATYVAFVRGCHYGTCTTGSGLPRQVSTIASIPSSFSVSPTGDAWDASYDVWFDHTTNTTSRNNGLEMMIWLDSTGVVPIGSQVDTASIAGATWQVWYSGGASPPVVSYRRAPTTTAMATFDIKAFMTDAISRNAATGTLPASGHPALDPAWYLTSVQAGFELWKGGANAQASSFAAAVN